MFGCGSELFAAKCRHGSRVASWHLRRAGRWLQSEERLRAPPCRKETAMVPIREARLEDRFTLSAALASAFAENPFFEWIAGPTAPLEARMRIVFDALLNMNLRELDHLVFTAEDGSGGAIWQPVGRWKRQRREIVRVLPHMLRAFRARVPTVVGALKALEHSHPTEPHYYLEAIGVRQDQRRTGIGSSLLRLVLDRCDVETVPAYLECSNPRSQLFYARQGFEIRGTIDCGKGAPVVTTMWREPQIRRATPARPIEELAIHQQ